MELRETLRYKAQGVAKSIAVVINAADGLEALIEKGIVPDVLTDQTSAHDPIDGYVPRGMSLEEAASLRDSDPSTYERLSFETMGDHVRAMLALQQAGCHHI